MASRTDAIFIYLTNARTNAEIADRGRDRSGAKRRCTGSRSVAFYLRDRVSKCKSNRPVAPEELRFARGNVAGGVLSSRETRTIVLHPRGGKAGGGWRRKEGEKGEWRERETKGEKARGQKGRGKEEREEVNQFESPGSDPAARERSAGQIAPYSFGPIRYTGRKAPGIARACGMATANGISRAWISRGFHRPKKNVYGFSRRIALRETRTLPSSLLPVLVVAKLARGRWR